MKKILHKIFCEHDRHGLFTVLLLLLSFPGMASEDIEPAVDSIRYNEACLLLEQSESFRENDREKALELGMKALNAATESRSNSITARAYKNLGILHYFRGDAEQAASWYSKALGLFLKEDNKHGAGSCYNNLALIYQQKGDFKKAYDLFYKSYKIDIFFRDTSGIASSCSNLGNIQFFRGDYRGAYYYYMKCYELTKYLHDTLGLSDIHINLANIYEKLQEYDKAISHYKTAIKYADIANSIYNRAICLYNMGGIYFQKNDLQKAMKLLNESLVIREELGDKAGEATVLAMIAQVYEELGYRIKANEIYMQALKINEEMENQRMIAFDMVQIGRNLIMQKQAEKALPYVRESVSIATRIGEQSVLLDSYRMLALNYASLSLHDSAVKYINLYGSLKSEIELDSLKLLTGRRLTRKVDDTNMTKDTSWSVITVSCNILIIALIVFNLLLLYKVLNRSSRKKIQAKNDGDPN